MKRTLIITLFATFLQVVSIAQTRNSMGLAIYSVFNDQKQASIGLGMLFEHGLTPLIGIESGVVYRNRKESDNIDLTGIPDARRLYTIRKDYLSFPICLKVSTPVVDIAAGLAIDYFASWEQTEGRKDIQILSYKDSQDFSLGWIIKAGKPIELNDRYILEPQVSYSALFQNDNRYLSFSIVGRIVM